MKRLRTTNDSVRIPIFTLFKGTGGSLNTKYMMTMKQIIAFEKSIAEIYVCFNVGLTVSVIKRAMQRFSWFVLSIFYISVMFSPLKQRVPLKALRRQYKIMIYTAVIYYFKTIYFNTDSGKPYMSMESQRCSGLILESQTWFESHFRYEKV